MCNYSTIREHGQVIDGHTLRYRLLLSIVVTLVCITAGFSLISSRVMLNSFAQLEERDTSLNVGRAGDALKASIAELHEKVIDWSSWDDSYKFMSDRNQAYVDSNLSTVNLPIDAIAYVNTNGSLYYGRPVDRLKDVPRVVPKALLKSLKFNRPAGERPGKDYKGLVIHNDIPLMVAVRRVLTTDGKGPSRGWLIFARYLSSVEVKNLAQQTHLNIALHDPATSLPAPCRVAAASLSKGARDIVTPLDDKRVAGVTLIKDVHGKPIRLLEIVAPRAIYSQGLATVTSVHRLLLIAGGLLGIVILLVLEFFALSRLSRLSKQVELIGDNTNSVHISLAGRDELASLAGKINGMLDKLDRGARRLRDSEQRLQQYNENLEDVVKKRTQEIQAKSAVLENAVEGISQIDSQGRYQSVNFAYAHMLGYTPDQIIGRSWTVSLPESEHAAISEATQAMVRDGKAEMETLGVRKDGTQFHKQVTLIAAYDDQGIYCGNYCFMKDISERKRLEMELEHQAFHDRLSGLPNRALFMDRTTFALAKATRNKLGTAVLFLDLDNFKLINDSMGHDMGDRLLRAVAERIESCVRPGDTVARLGGDEFTILLEDLADVGGAEEIASRILSSLLTPINLPRSEAFASCSIGIAFTMDPSTEPAVLMKMADTAMYHAKAHNRSTFATYDVSMSDHAEERMVLETALRKALDRDELVVHYQPLIDLTTGRFSGAEALVRWQHPTQGIIPPGHFIPIAEETGLITSIGYWVLEEACRQMKEWQDAFKLPALSISVNLSGKQLQRTDVIERVQAALDKTGIAPSCLKLEITESVLMTGMDDAISKMHAMKVLGIKLAIDDFGTGYSSLSSLDVFPVDTVKIDRAFINRMDEHESAVNIVAAIATLCRSVNMDITAEGVETGTKSAFIQELGCHTGQGYHYSRPLTAEVFEERLRSGGRVSLDEITAPTTQDVEMVKAA